MHIEIGTSSNFAFAFTVAIKETRDHQLQPPTKIYTKYRKYIFKKIREFSTVWADRAVFGTTEISAVEAKGQ